VFEAVAGVIINLVIVVRGDEISAVTGWKLDCSDWRWRLGFG
jgi:hypothetical protein